MLKCHVLAGYLQKQPYFGAVVGRVANRIAKGTFMVNGKEYKLAVNNGPNSLHGGLRGFDKVSWGHWPDSPPVTLDKTFKHTFCLRGTMRGLRANAWSGETGRGRCPGWGEPLPGPFPALILCSSDCSRQGSPKWTGDSPDLGKAGKDFLTVLGSGSQVDL